MELITARSIFSPATGFIRRGGFDWTCNPYIGCTFGCTYCYAMFLPQNRQPLDEWGRWLAAKSNAVECANRQARKVAGSAVYMSSVTDPYLPVERSLRLTCGVLAALVPWQPRLVIQTRGPLVVRDTGLLKKFDALRVNISIPTDSLAAWKSFEPRSPPLEDRWNAAAALKNAGLSVGLCLTPLLPLDDPARFADRVAAFQADVTVVQEFHESQGRFGADTGPKARRVLPLANVRRSEYQMVLERLSQKLPVVHEGEAGFFPPSIPSTN